MAKIPGQRQPGSRGGAGGQLSNRGMSYNRGGRPSASRSGGGGGGKKGGCFTIILVGVASASIIGGATGAWQIFT